MATKAVDTKTSSKNELERLTQLGVSTMRELRQMRQGSPIKIIQESKTQPLEETIKEETVVETVVEEEDIEEEQIEVSVSEQDLEATSNEEEEEQEEEEEEGSEEEKEADEEEDVGEEEDSILAAIKAAYASNDDLYINTASIPARAQRVREQLEKYGEDKLLYAAIFVAHLWTGSFVGAHSYTFRQEVVIQNKYNLDSLMNKDYFWPEVYNNGYMTPEMKMAYAKVDEDEITKIADMLEQGIPLPDHKGFICYTTSDTCTSLRPCSVTAKREIIVPGMQDDKPVGYCFRREVLFDALLTEEQPANPDTGEAFPPRLVKKIYEKYKGEILMRNYFLELHSR